MATVAREKCWGEKRRKKRNEYTKEIQGGKKNWEPQRWKNKDIKGIKIAVPNYYMSDAIDSEVKNKILEVIDMLKNKGAIVDYIDID